MAPSLTRRVLTLAVALALGASSLCAPGAAVGSGAAATTAPPPAQLVVPAPAPPSVAMAAGILQSMDGDATLWSRNAGSQRRVASTIKMLNALVVQDHAELTDVVVVTKKAEAIANGDVGLRAGQRLTVKQLLQMMLVASANDAAEAVAIHIGGTEANYVRMMNAKARQLGLAHTHADDPHGLSKREYSTAGDLAVLARQVMRDPVLRGIVRQRVVWVPRRGGKADMYRSTDQLLGSYQGIEGVKTGYTRASGYCFVGAAKRGDVELLGVVLGTPTNKARFAQMRRLLDWGFAHYRKRFVVSKEATAGIAAVAGGVEATVSVHPGASYAALEFDGDPYTRVFQVATSTAAPVSAGQRVGQVVVVRGGTTIATVPLVADRAIAAAPQPLVAQSASIIVGISNVWQRLLVVWDRILGG